jgi:hypothetical protein
MQMSFGYVRLRQESAYSTFGFGRNLRILLIEDEQQKAAKSMRMLAGPLKGD